MVAMGADTLGYVTKLEFSPGQEFGGHRPGGLSGLAWDAETRSLVAVSDGRRGEATTVWTFPVDCTAESLTLSGEPSVLLLEGKPLDAEGLALTGQDRMFIAHEGSRDTSLPPGLACFDRITGALLFTLPIPADFLPRPGENYGLQFNRGFESVALAPESSWLFAANESPLWQDAASMDQPWQGPVRLLRYDLRDQTKPPQERAYLPDRDAVFNSVVDVMARTDKELWVMERALLRSTPPRTVRVRIYRVDFSDPKATDVTGWKNLSARPVVHLAKSLLFDSATVGLDWIDNLEGFCLGPEIDGQRSLLMVSDDNFRKDQRTQFLLFRINH